MIASALAGFARLLSGSTVHWVQPPTDIRQRVFFGNHTSHLDFVVVWSALPPAMRARTRPVAGADYWGKGRLKRYLSRTVFNAILIERAGAASSPATAAQSLEQIAAGMGTESSIIVFPEGTRSMDGTLLPFKSGMYHLCTMKPGLELVPVYLANLNRILPKGEILPVPLLGRVVFGPPMSLEPNEEKAAFLTRAREALLALKDQ